MRTGRKSNNGGFSLVELIIVIAIMAILVGVMAISASSLTGRKVKNVQMRSCPRSKEPEY